MKSENGHYAGRDLHALLNDSSAITAAINKGIRDAMIRHKKLGESIAVWDDENNCVKIVAPEDIVIDDE